MIKRLPCDVKSILKEKQLDDVTIKVQYKNHRGEVCDRKTIPLNIFYGQTGYPPQDQWIIKVWDVDKKDYRAYALKDIEEWKN